MFTIVRETLYKTIVIEGEIEFNSEYSKASWGFIARVRGSIDGKLLKGDIRVQGLLLNWLSRIFAKDRLSGGLVEKKVQKSLTKVGKVRAFIALGSIFYFVILFSSIQLYFPTRVCPGYLTKPVIGGEIRKMVSMAEFKILS